MEWITSIRESLDYVEHNLLTVSGPEEVAREVHISSFYLQKGFAVMTGYSIAEYIRDRRLYLAALDVITGQEKVISIAMKYGYDTPESFTKAFSRFHGVSPTMLRNNPGKIHVFLPLKITIQIQGGNDMDFTVEKMNGFKVIGFERDFSNEDSYQKIPKFWEEYAEKYMNKMLCSGADPQNQTEQAICDNKIGEYGVCVDDIGKDNKFRYFIAGKYQGGEVPEGMTLYEFPDMEWAKFRCVGPLPGALQAVNTKIFKEWLPGNPDYEIAVGANIEWYSMADGSSSDYESGIWIPVRHK